MPHAFVAHTSEDAIDVIRRYAPNVIFLDFDLGQGLDTVAVAEYLQEQGFGGRVVILRKPIRAGSSSAYSYLGRGDAVRLI